MEYKERNLIRSVLTAWNLWPLLVFILRRIELNSPALPSLWLLLVKLLFRTRLENTPRCSTSCTIFKLFDICLMQLVHLLACTYNINRCMLFEYYITSMFLSAKYYLLNLLDPKPTGLGSWSSRLRLSSG